MFYHLLILSCLYFRDAELMREKQRKKEEEQAAKMNNQKQTAN